MKPWKQNEQARVRNKKHTLRLTIQEGLRMKKKAKKYGESLTDHLVNASEAYNPKK